MKNTGLNYLLSQVEKALDDEKYQEVKLLCEKIVSGISDDTRFISEELTLPVLNEVRKGLDNLLEGLTKPVLSRLWNILGGIYYTARQYRQAINCYRKSIVLDETDTSSWYNLGNVFCDFKEYQHATECYKKSITLLMDLCYKKAPLKK